MDRDRVVAIGTVARNRCRQVKTPLPAFALGEGTDSGNDRRDRLAVRRLGSVGGRLDFLRRSAGSTKIGDERGEEQEAPRNHQNHKPKQHSPIVEHGQCLT